VSRPRWPGSSGWSPKRRRRRRARALADRAATFLFYFALGAGVLTFEAWSLLGSVDEAVTVLVIACPHALGLAIPLVIAISTERAARAGVLVKDRLARERMRTGVQPGRGPLAVGVLAFGRCRAVPGRGRRDDVGVHRRRGGQRAAAAPP